MYVRVYTYNIYVLDYITDYCMCSKRAILLQEYIHMHVLDYNCKCSKRAILLQEYIHIHVLDYVTDYCIEPLPHPVALLRLYEGSMKALLRLY